MSGLAIWIIIIGSVVLASPSSVGRWIARVHKSYRREVRND